jgi:type I restriction enzyme, S subunit
MIEGWETYDLGDLLGKKGYIRGPFGSALRRPEMKKEGIPVYEQQHAIYNSREFRYYIDEEKFKELSRFQVQTNDLIISCSGTLGKISIIEATDPKGIISQALLLLRPDTNLVKPKYLQFYFSTSYGFNQLVQASYGSVQQNIASRKTVESIKLELPPLECQEEIASILSSLDDKIELNLQMNKTLETIAQAIFKEWFVDFRFPGFNGVTFEGLPIHWKEGVISDIYKTTSGGTPSRAREDFYKDGTIRWVKSKELNGSFIFDTEEMITEEALRKSSAKIIPEHSVLVAMYGATVGEHAILSKEATCNQAICAIKPNCSYPYTYILLHLRMRMNSIIDQSSGSAQQNISQELIQRQKIIIPPPDIVKKFHEIVSPLFAMVENNVLANITLRQIRDAILPKLMTGQIKVY